MTENNKKASWMNLFKGDRAIWFCITILFIFSALSVFSTLGGVARNNLSNVPSLWLRHLFFYFLAILTIIIIVNFISIRLIKLLSPLFLLGTLFLLVVTWVMGASGNEVAARWLYLPGLSTGMQPSEFAKIALLLYLAKILSPNMTEEKRKFAVYKSLTLILLLCGIISFENFSTAALLGVVSVFVLLLGGAPKKYLFGLVGLGLLFVLFAYFTAPFFKVGRFGVIRNRIDSFIEQRVDPSQSHEFQMEQSQIAIASGGILGQGPGNSNVKYYLPASYNDFIFASIKSEYGFFSLFVVFAYVMFYFRIVYISERTEDKYEKLIVAGLGTLVALQAIINISVSLDMIPITGQTLPLVSLGGSSLLASGIIIGIILRVSRNIQRRKAKEASE